MSKKKPNSKKSQSPSAKPASSGRKSILYFTIGMAVIMLVYFWISFQPFFSDYINEPILKGYAWLTGMVLNVFGFGTWVEGTSLSNDLFSMNVQKGCDGVTATFLVLAATLAFPILFKWKIRALIAGPLALALLNLIRLISLFLIGIYLPDFFEIAHVEIWQVLFIVAAVLGWLYWAVWAMNNDAKTETI